MSDKRSLRQKLFPTKKETEARVKTYSDNVERAATQAELVEAAVGHPIQKIPVLGSKKRVASHAALNAAIDALRKEKKKTKPRKPSTHPQRGPNP